MNINREDLAWAAGFFEGEGNFHRNKVNPKTGSPAYATFQIAQMNLEPLQRFLSTFPFLNPPRPQGKSQILALRSSKFEHVQAVIACMWPWLSIKRKKQACVALKGLNN